MFPAYIPSDVRLHAPFKLPIDFTYHYGSIYVSTSGRISFIVAIWDRRQHRLYVYGEIIKATLDPQEMALKIFQGMGIGKRPFLAIYGNKEMFDDHMGQTESRLINTELARLARQYKIRSTPVIREPYQYDRTGCMALTNQMCQQTQITIHECCDELSRQMSGWYVENDKPVKGFDLCECVLQVVSEVNRTERIIEKIKKPTDYRTIVDPATLKPLQRIKEKSWQLS